MNIVVRRQNLLYPVTIESIYRVNFHSYILLKALL